MAPSADRDWFRSPTWDADVEDAFEDRLRRARPINRPQYVRIQGSHLLESADPTTREAGRTLLRRVVAEYPKDFQAKSAMEQLGNSLAEEGDLSDAEQALREALRMCAESSTGKSGTSGTIELRLAEVILAAEDSDRIDEVAEILHRAESEVEQLGLFRNIVFRYLLASAKVAHLRHDPAAAQLAGAALEIAADVGGPAASAIDVAVLERIATGL